MSMPLDWPVLGWRTLKEMYEHYLSRTPSDEGIPAAEAIRDATARVRLHSVAAEVHTAFGTISTERRDEVLAGIEKAKEQVARLGAMVSHIMVRDGAEGVWFAIGRADSSSPYEFIQPNCWQFLLVDIERGVAWREPGMHFEDLRCAFTRDVPPGHPLLTFLGTGAGKLEHAGFAPQLPARASPPLASEPPQEVVRTGAPGRPSSMHFVVKEFQRRVQAGDVKFISLTAEAEALKSWFVAAHPKLPPPSARTIENKIRGAYRRAKDGKSEPMKL